MRSLPALLGAFVLAMAVLTLTAAPAKAHAVLVSSTPMDGSRVESSPPTVTLTFDEPVRLTSSATQVISSTGLRADAAAHLTADGATVVIPLRADLPRGSYSATWRVVSADTHVVSGSITFGVGQDAGAAPTPSVVHDGPLVLAASITRGVGYLGLVLSAGLALVCRMLWPWALWLTRVRVLLLCGWIALAGATVLQFLLQGPQSLNVGLSQAFSSAAVTDTLGDRTGQTLIVRAAFVAVLGVALRSGRRRCTVALATSASGIAVTVAMDGHAAVGGQAWLATAVTCLHVLAMMIWLGGLVALGVAVLPSGRGLNLRRWSFTAVGCVAVLILSGGYQAWRQVRPVEAMWTTGYGLTLSVKLALVMAMLVLASVAQRRLTPRTLRRTVPVEMALGMAVVVATAALVSQPPARTTYGPPVTLSAPMDGRSALVHVDTTRRGPTRISVTALDAGGHPLRATAIRGALSSEDAGIAALAVTFQPAADDRWQSLNAVVPVSGWWTLRLVVEFSSADAVATTTHYRAW